MAFVNGVGKTKFGVLADGLPELIYKATTECLADASVEINDVDSVYVANFAGGPQASQLHLNSLFSSIFPEFSKTSMRIEAACASGGAAINQAVRMLSGSERILVIGVEKLSLPDPKTTSASIAMAGDRTLDQSTGMIFPAAYALIAQQHMLEFGTTAEDLAHVSLKNHENANLNPTAHFFGKHVTLEQIEKSPMVCSPLRLFDCSPISDGAAAVLLSREKGRNSVELAASAVSTDSLSFLQRKTLTSFPAAKRAAKDALSAAHCAIRDIDFAEVHDCFTIAELVACEDIGFCPAGESGRFARSGETSLSGSIPVNPDGGLKADGHPIGATGVAQVVELAAQLRCEAGKRQVDGARTGLAHNVGGVGGTVAVTILKAV